MISLSYQEVLHAKFARLGHISVMWELAKQLQYPYFLWNDHVFNTSDASDTGLFNADVK